MPLVRPFARRDPGRPSRSLCHRHIPAAHRRRRSLLHVELLEARMLLADSPVDPSAEAPLPADPMPPADPAGDGGGGAAQLPEDPGWVVDAVGAGDDPSGLGLATDSTGNVYVAGSFNGSATFAPGVTLASAGASDVFVAKYAPTGALLWAQRAGGGAGSDTAYGIALDSSGNVYVTGAFVGTADFGSTILNSVAGSGDIFVTRIDGTTGSFLWANAAGGTAQDSARSIAADSGGNVYVTGSFQGTATFGTTTLTGAGDNDTFIWQLDTNGNSGWARGAGSTGFDIGTSIAADATGLYTTGWFQGSVAFGSSSLTSAGNDDIFLSHLDTQGNFLWTRQVGGAGGDRAWGITLDTASNVLVTGALVGALGQDAFVSKLDNAGNTVWTKTFGESGQADVCNTGGPVGRDIAVDSSGNVYTIGYFAGTADFDPGSGVAYLSSTSPNASNVFVAKLDPSGNFVSARRMGGSGGAFGYGIALDGQSSIYITGSFKGTADFDTGTATASVTSAGAEDFFVSRVTQDRAAIFGQVFDDLTDNAARDFGDTGLGGWSVYLDQNNNGVRDTAEPSTTTGPAGSYRFAQLAVGTYVVREVAPSGWTQAYPASNAGQVVTLATGQFVDSQDFANFDPTAAVGWFWGEGGCKDLQTGLVWSPDTTISSGSWGYWSGMQHALDLSQNGFSDWRNATILEMQTASAHGAPSVGITSGDYWSMTLTGRTATGKIPTAWSYNFDSGTPIERGIGSYDHQILVRGGSSVYFADDGAPGYSDTGSWTIVTGQGQEGDYRYHAKGDGSSKATWSFTGLRIGTYQVQTTWVPQSSNASNAPYQILDGATLLGTVSVNQQNAPSTTIYSKTTIPWQTLGTFSITGSTLNVVLNNNARGNVQADMVRLVPVTPTLSTVAAAFGVRTAPRRVADALPAHVRRAPLSAPADSQQLGMASTRHARAHDHAIAAVLRSRLASRLLRGRELELDADLLRDLAGRFRWLGGWG